MIRVLYFASLRERLGRDAEEIEGPADSVAELLAVLRARGGAYSAALGERETVLVARNQEMAHLDTPIADGDEIGIFPPVTGG
jgi:molybdopterin synthase sulfur carrier subunit